MLGLSELCCELIQDTIGDNSTGSCAVDPTSDLFGLKFDLPRSPPQCEGTCGPTGDRFSVVFAGSVATGCIKIANKANGGEDISTACIAGPDCVPSECGNGICEEDESKCNCPEDCPEDVCGDGCCTGVEDCETCPIDCPPICGDGVCECGEDCNSCLPDCPPTCGDGVCDPGEDPCSCEADCGVPPSSETSCDDGVDEDCDGAADCSDPTGECDADPACDCLGKREICADDSECCSGKCRGGRCR